MPRNYNKQAQLQDPNNFISANMRLFSIQKNQDNASDHIEATSTSIKPNKSQYTVNTGDIIPKLDDIVVQCESFMLEVDEIMFDWSNSHAIEFEKTDDEFVDPEHILIPGHIPQVHDPIIHRPVDYENSDTYEERPVWDAYVPGKAPERVPFPQAQYDHDYPKPEKPIKGDAEVDHDFQVRVDEYEREERDWIAEYNRGRDLFDQIEQDKQDEYVILEDDQERQHQGRVIDADKAFDDRIKQLKKDHIKEQARIAKEIVTQNKANNAGI